MRLLLFHLKETEREKYFHLAQLGLTTPINKEKGKSILWLTHSLTICYLRKYWFFFDLSTLGVDAYPKKVYRGIFLNFNLFLIVVVAVIKSGSK